MPMTYAAPEGNPQDQVDRSRVWIAICCFSAMVVVTYLLGQQEVTPLQAATLRMATALSVVSVIAAATALFIHGSASVPVKALVMAGTVTAGAASYVVLPVHEVPESVGWILGACKTGRVNVLGAQPPTREPQIVAIAGRDGTLVRMLIWGGLPTERRVVVQAEGRSEEIPGFGLTSSLNNAIKRGGLEGDQISCIKATAHAIETAGIEAAPPPNAPQPPGPGPNPKNPT
jgi:hypothetical protein